MDYNNPKFVHYLNTISNNILKQVPTENYFKLNNDKKFGLEYTIFTLLKTSIKINVTINETHLKSFITFLCKKNEENENYEFAAILSNIIENFDKIYNLQKKNKIKKSEDLIKK